MTGTQGVQAEGWLYHVALESILFKRIVIENSCVEQRKRV